MQKTGFDPWVRKIPWRRKWKPTPVNLPGKSHGQRSLVGCRLWGRTESDTTEATQQQQQFYYYYLLFIYSVSCSVVPDSLQPLGLQPARLLCPWDFPGQDTGFGCHFLLQGIFLTQGSNPVFCTEGRFFTN